MIARICTQMPIQFARSADDQNNTPTPNFASTNTSTAAATRTITSTAISTLSFIETSTGTYRNWLQYIHTVYGFSFAAPPDWNVSELNNNFIQLNPSAIPDIKLTIGVRWADEDVRIQRTGVPEGEIVRVGEIFFWGRKYQKGSWYIKVKIKPSCMPTV